MPDVARRCVVFDLDDTLFLERDYVRSGFEAVGAWARRRLGISGFGERCWAAFERGDRGRVFDGALTASGMAAPAELVTELVDVYRRHRPAIELLEDARACIERLRRRGDSLAVVTDGPLVSQQRKAEALGVSRWAETVVFTEAFGPGFGKPHRRAFAAVEASCGPRGAACSYVADNPAKDFAGPKALGWRTVRLRRPLGLHEARPSSPEVDVEMVDLSELDVWLDGPDGPDSRPVAAASGPGSAERHVPALVAGPERGDGSAADDAIG
jgi:putative hydrolase of the HAD superfamily